MRTVEDWARDGSLYFRLRDSVFEMARGRGKWADRARYSLERLAPLRQADFPDHLQGAFALIIALRDDCVVHFEVSTMLLPGNWSPNQRDAFTDALLALYEEMTKARAVMQTYSGLD